MKTYVIISVVLFCLIAFEANAKDVNLEENTLESLEKIIYEYQEKAIEGMPKSVRSHLLSIDKPKSIHDLKDKDSVIWFEKHIIYGGGLELSECIKKLESSLALSGDRINGEDLLSIKSDSFFALWNKEDFNLSESIRSYAIYWREHSKPPVRVSPDGQNPIDWIWGLEVKSREHGVLHVGLDEKKRTFVCYEYPVGLYFPEGETMERIYREIVQNPDMALHYIGLGRKQNRAPTE
jgi:hypothetical protein